eukprot:5047980-Pleurochrysis_carterae.AAC.1
MRSARTKHPPPVASFTGTGSHSNTEIRLWSLMGGSALLSLACAGRSTRLSVVSTSWAPPCRRKGYVTRETRAWPRCCCCRRHHRRHRRATFVTAAAVATPAAAVATTAATVASGCRRRDEGGF